MPSTAHRALPYPAASAVPDVPLDLQNLAAALDFDLFVISGTSRPAAGTLGRVYFHTGTGVMSFDTGVAWIDYLTAVPGGTYLLLAGGTMSGALDMGAQELRNSIVLNARDKRFTATVSGSVTVNADNGPSQSLTLNGNVTAISISNLGDGESIRIELIEDATGGRTIQAAFNAAGWLWVGGVSSGSAPFSTAANARNVLVVENAGGSLQAFLAGDVKT